MTQELFDGKELLSNIKFFTDYSRYIESEKRWEQWEDSVARVMGMHRTFYAKVLAEKPELENYFDLIEESYLDKQILASQRSLQFGGAPILKHHAKMYNCVVSYADRPRFFQEALYLLLCGCGVGFSIQKKHVSKLPNVYTRNPNNREVYVIEDSIEGWADAVGVLLSSFFSSKDAEFPYFSGKKVLFDYSAIRPKGAFISGGFKAPGPDGLRRSMELMEKILINAASEEGRQLRPIEVYDIVMHCSDAVLSGGVRRSATIALFDLDDVEMLNAKTGSWYIDNPQRGRSNNSAVLVRGETTKEQFDEIMKSTEEFGEPGFIWTYDRDILFNPCVEIGMYPQDDKGNSGWQGCNLTEINGGMCKTPDDLFEAAAAAAALGTLQAGYAEFPYLGPVSEKIFRREALLGVSITGFMENPHVLLDPDVQVEAAEIVKEINKEVAALIGINQAARTTCTKPSGNASVILKTTSGIHGEHAPMYFRCMQINKQSEVAKMIMEKMPKILEESHWSANKSDYIAYIPVYASDTAIFKPELYGTKLLEAVKSTQQHWVEYGTNHHLCVHPKTRHNVSNTITVDNWKEVGDFIFDNQNYLTGVSLLGMSGDKDYTQAPFTEVKTAQRLLNEYGPASMLASGLVVDALHAFNNNLWVAIQTARGFGEDISEDSHNNAIKRDWVRRFKKFSAKYFESDIVKTDYCLKDVFLLHKWLEVTSIVEQLDWSKYDAVPEYTEVADLGAMACAGGACDVGIKL